VTSFLWFSFPAKLVEWTGIAPFEDPSHFFPKSFLMELPSPEDPYGPRFMPISIFFKNIFPSGSPPDLDSAFPWRLFIFQTPQTGDPLEV